MNWEGQRGKHAAAAGRTRTTASCPHVQVETLRRRAADWPPAVPRKFAMQVSCLPRLGGKRLTKPHIDGLHDQPGRPFRPAVDSGVPGAQRLRPSASMSHPTPKLEAAPLSEKPPGRHRPGPLTPAPRKRAASVPKLVSNFLCRYQNTPLNSIHLPGLARSLPSSTAWDAFRNSTRVRERFRSPRSRPASSPLIETRHRGR